MKRGHSTKLDGDPVIFYGLAIAYGVEIYVVITTLGSVLTSSL